MNLGKKKEKKKTLKLLDQEGASCSRLSASLTSLNVVNHPAQTSTAALFIRRSYVSTYRGCGKETDASIKGRETDHLARGEALSAIQAKCTFVCQPEYPARKN